MIDKYCRKIGPLEYKEELTFYHTWICKFLTCSVPKRNVKFFLCISKCLADDLKVALATFFLASCSTPYLDIVHYFLINQLLKLCFLNL